MDDRQSSVTSNGPADVPAVRAGVQVDPQFGTFPKLLRRNATLRGDRPAMREKKFGIWQINSTGFGYPPLMSQSWAC